MNVDDAESVAKSKWMNMLLAIECTDILRRRMSLRRESRRKRKELGDGDYRDTDISEGRSR